MFFVFFIGLAINQDIVKVHRVELVIGRKHDTLLRLT